MPNSNNFKSTKPKPTKPKTNKSKCIPPGVNAFIVLPGGCKYVFKDAIEISAGFERDASFVETPSSAGVKSVSTSSESWLQNSSVAPSFGPYPADCIVDRRTGIEVPLDESHSTLISKEVSSSSVSVHIPSAPTTVGFRGGQSIVHHSETRVASSGWSKKNVVSLYSKPCNNISVSDFKN